MYTKLMGKIFSSWKYPNLTVFAFGIIIAFILAKSSSLSTSLLVLKDLGWIGAFLGGVLFVSTFTIAIGAVILITLADVMSPLEIGLIGGLGAVLADYAIFRFIREDLLGELNLLTSKIGGRSFKHFLHHLFSFKHFHWKWVLPLIGALIIASPLPDEPGIALMGVSKIKTYQFIILTFILDSLGIFLIALIAGLG